MTSIDQKKLPTNIPVFPLQGALLLPGGRLPLQIFEPRYLQMVREALSQDGFIGIIQPKALDHKNLPKSHLLYPIGCVGKIIDVSERDNRILDIVVLGLSRYKILNEIPCDTPFRQAHVDYSPYKQDLKLVEKLPQGGRQKLLETVGRYTSKQDLSLNKKALGKLADDELVTALAMLCPFEPAEKQALLENNGILLRAGTLSTLMEIALASQSDTSNIALH